MPLTIQMSANSQVRTIRFLTHVGSIDLLQQQRNAPVLPLWKEFLVFIVHDSRCIWRSTVQGSCGVALMPEVMLWSRDGCKGIRHGWELRARAHIFYI